MTQQEKLLDLLRKGPVVAKQAHAAGIKKPSAVVCILRQAGHKISSEMVKVEGKMYARYTLAASGPVKLARGKKAKRAADCKVGDIVLHKGRKVLVTQILEEGKRGERSYIAAAPFHPVDGKPLRSVLIPVGQNWSKA